MAHYTTTIKTLINNNFDFKLDSYPIFDEDYRSTLNDLILYYYYDREIGFETAALFRQYLLNKMNLIMPYYNILYTKQKELIKNFDRNINLTENFNSTQTKNDTNNTTSQTNSTSSSNSSNTTNAKNLFQDTPQGNISSEDINAANVYANNISLDNSSNSTNLSDSSNSNGTANSTMNSNGTDNYIKSIIGNNGKKFNIELLRDLKNNLINIDLMIINDLDELFMQIF